MSLSSGPFLRVLSAVWLVVGSLVVPVGPAAATPTLTPASAPTSGSTFEAELSVTTQSAPPDPPSDRIGWEEGYWWNESISVDVEDGLNRSELRPVLARTMARVERIRQLEFLSTPDFAFRTRKEYRRWTSSTYYQNYTDADWLHQNTKFEALFLVGEQRNYFEVARQNEGSAATAFYTSEDIEKLNISGGTVVVVVREEGIARFRTGVLAHELVHALQDQHFGFENIYNNYDVRTEEDNLRFLGALEGDAEYVRQLYNSGCGLEFECLSIDPPQGAPSDYGDRKLVAYRFVPYRHGPGLIRQIEESSGWEAVNRLYTDRPLPSTEVYIHPDRYGEDPPTEVTIRDESTDEWYVPNTSGGVDYASFGEAGIFTMFFEFGASRAFPADYDDEVSEGWDGDRLVPYARNDSVSSGETGYVWKIAWDSEQDAREFVAAYREKLDFYSAREVLNAEDVYIIPESENADFGDAFALRVNGTSTVIVNAPSVAELNEIRPGTVPENARTPTPTPTETDTPTPTETETTVATTTDATTAPPETAPGTTTGGQPGFGVGIAIVSLLAGALLARRRRSDG